MLGVHQPDFGYLTDAMVFSGQMPISRLLIQPRAEGEIVAPLTAVIGEEAVLYHEHGIYFSWAAFVRMGITMLVLLATVACGRGYWHRRATAAAGTPAEGAQQPR